MPSCESQFLMYLSCFVFCCLWEFDVAEANRDAYIEWAQSFVLMKEKGNITSLQEKPGLLRKNQNLPFDMRNAQINTHRPIDDHNFESCNPPEFSSLTKGLRHYNDPREIAENGCVSVDGVVIPSGGLEADGTPNAITRARINAAGLLYQLCGSNFTQYWISSGAFTPLKPPLRTKEGMPIGEGRSDALYLVKHWGVQGRIIVEEMSKDSLGNGFFTRLITSNLKFKRILVITNYFHMPRIKAVFQWVTSLAPALEVELSFLNVQDAIPAAEVLKSRVEKEKQSLENFWCSTRSKIKNMKELTEFMYMGHQAYALNASEIEYNIVLPEKILATY